MKSKPRVRESDALCQRTRIDTDAVVLHTHGESIAHNACADRQLAAEWRVCQPVDDRVFDERLQQQVRHGDVERVVGDVNAHAKPVSKSALLDFQVCAQKSKLIAEWNVATSCMAQRFDEQCSQVAKRASCSRSVAISELRDEVQRVEEKMRVKLQREDMHCLLYTSDAA